VKALLALGADPNERLHDGGLDWTPLAMAIALHHAGLVDLLVAHGADVNARWCTPVDLSRDAHPVPDPGCAPGTGMTALLLAASQGDLDTVSRLLSRGADRTLSDWRSWTADTYERDSGHPEIVEAIRRR